MRTNLWSSSQGPATVTDVLLSILSARVLLLDPGGLISGHRHHQRLFFISFAQEIREHEGREEAKLHSEGELKQLQVDAQHPLEYSRQVDVVVFFLGKQSNI